VVGRALERDSSAARPPPSPRGFSTGSCRGSAHWRQLRDWKGSFDVAAMRPADLDAYARLCGVALTRAHARSGDPVMLAGYLGAGADFERSVDAFAAVLPRW